MTLLDAGPLVALLDACDPDHARCVSALGNVVKPLLTTWPAITEAMYFVGKKFGWPGQAAIWDRIHDGAVTVVEHMEGDRSRMAELMKRYDDLPMDLADASLVAVADRLGTRRIFTLDSDFSVYRTARGKAFLLNPA